MSAKKTVFTTFVLLGLCALVVGCGDDSVAPTTDEAPILAPQNLSIVRTVDEIQLTWDPVAQGNLAGYNVYRTVFGSGVLVKLTHSPITETMYVDTDVEPGKSYRYRVTSVTTNLKESPYALVNAGPQGANREKHQRPNL
ncbi:MAG: fibronectin type III domain-containing protein [Candidatus Latescibacterota bacterium]|nr:MAG: fibronectin type III domain-containing protein [Candidatus Latescibacterota bacterium]